MLHSYFRLLFFVYLKTIQNSSPLLGSVGSRRSPDADDRTSPNGGGNTCHRNGASGCGNSNNRGSGGGGGGCDGNGGGGGDGSGGGGGGGGGDRGRSSDNSGGGGRTASGTTISNTQHIADHSLVRQTHNHHPHSLNHMSQNLSQSNTPMSRSHGNASQDMNSEAGMLKCYLSDCMFCTFLFLNKIKVTFTAFFLMYIITSNKQINT